MNWIFLLFQKYNTKIQQQNLNDKRTMLIVIHFEFEVQSKVLVVNDDGISWAL